jgi:diadenosine tetraphosphate (Ap4A) HIT family hydrolase
MHTAHRLAQCLAQVYQPPKVGRFIAGFHVPHTHVHVVPLYAMQDLTAEAIQRAMRTPPASDALADSSRQIRQALSVMEGDTSQGQG